MREAMGGNLDYPYGRVKGLAYRLVTEFIAEHAPAWTRTRSTMLSTVGTRVPEGLRGRKSRLSRRGTGSDVAVDPAFGAAAKPIAALYD